MNALKEHIGIYKNSEIAKTLGCSRQNVAQIMTKSLDNCSLGTIKKVAAAVGKKVELRIH